MSTFDPHARSLVARLPASRIREVANAALGRDGVLPFWFGESDEVTPSAIGDAATRSIAAGETFYAHNLGLPELRESLATYLSGLHRPVAADRLAVTSGGVNGLMVAMQALIDPRDEVVAVVPLWPNLTAQAEIMGAQVRRVSLRVDPERPHAGWTLDLPALLHAITPSTRALLLNAPNNPTGWTITADEQAQILAHCRHTGTWIVSDEVYERVYFDAPSMHAGGRVAAPSFLDIADPDDRLIVVNSFSKSFLMTGWRLGWMVLPAPMQADIGKLLEFNTSCAPVFVQRAGLAALAAGEPLITGVVDRIRAGRDALLPGLMAMPGVQVAMPRGGMYAFFRVDGHHDSLQLAKRLVTEVGLGLAPGAAFGEEGEGWLRWCFASRQPERLGDGLQRLARALGL